MDKLDMEIQEMLKDPIDDSRSRETEFSFDDEEFKAIKKIVDNSKPVHFKQVKGTITLKYAEINLGSGFILVSEEGAYYGTFYDNCTIALEDEIGKYGRCFHNRNGSGYYLYFFDPPIRLEVSLVKLFFGLAQKYVFKVIQNE